MIEVKDLALTIEKQVPGELVTNALAIKAFVEERVKEYTAERYFDDPDAAKKDRSVLNAASKELNSKRLSMEREFMAPFEEFKSIIKQTTNAIDYAASKLDEVVKAVEETIKADKMEKIEAIFEGKKFELAPLKQIFDQKWLNKGTSLKTVEAEIDAMIGRIYLDIATIEELPFDVSEVKANYLETLDIGKALATAQRLKANRERLAAEAKGRDERLHNTQIQSQKKELAVQAVEEAKSDSMASVAAEALEVEKDPMMEFTRRFRGTKVQMIKLLNYMNEIGIEHWEVKV